MTSIKIPIISTRHVHTVVKIISKRQFNHGLAFDHFLSFSKCERSTCHTHTLQHRKCLQCCQVFPAKSSAFRVASPTFFLHLPSTSFTLPIVSANQKIAHSIFSHQSRFSYRQPLKAILYQLRQSS